MHLQADKKCSIGIPPSASNCKSIKLKIPIAIVSFLGKYTYHQKFEVGDALVPKIKQITYLECIVEKKFGIFSSIASLNSSSPFSKEADRFRFSLEEFCSFSGVCVSVLNAGLSSVTRGCGELDGADRERGLSFSGELSEIVRRLEETAGGYLSDTEYDLDSYKMIDR